MSYQVGLRAPAESGSLVRTTWAAIAGPAALLALFSISLPVELKRAKADSTESECLTIRDRPAAAVPAGRIALLEKCRAVDPRNAEAIADLAAEYEAVANVHLAQELYRTALVLDPYDGDVRLRLATLLVRQGHPLEARREAQAVLAVKPNDPAATALLQATATSGATP